MGLISTRSLPTRKTFGGSARHLWEIVRSRELSNGSKHGNLGDDLPGFCLETRKAMPGAILARSPAIRLPSPQRGEGSCEPIENRLLPALSVRRSARATLVERALRVRFHLWIQRRDGAGLAQFQSFHSFRGWE